MTRLLTDAEMFFMPELDVGTDTPTSEDLGLPRGSLSWAERETVKKGKVTLAEMRPIARARYAAFIADEIPELSCGCSWGWRCKDHARRRTGTNMVPAPKAEAAVLGWRVPLTQKDDPTYREPRNPGKSTPSDQGVSELSGTTCEACGSPFVARRRTARFCSNRCKKRAQRRNG